MLMPRNAKGNPIPEHAEGRIFKGWIRILIPNQHSQGAVENTFKPYKGRQKTKKKQKKHQDREQKIITHCCTRRRQLRIGIFAYY